METETKTRTPRVNPDSIRTAYRGFIQLYDRDTGARLGSSSVHGDDLGGLIADIVENATYHLIDRKCRVESVERYCVECSGRGSIYRGPRKPETKCKSCKGIGVFPSGVADTDVRESMCCTLSHCQHRG